MEGDKWNRGDRGEGARESRGQERDLFEGGKREQKLKKKHSYFVYNRLSSSFRTSSYLTSTDALKPSLSIPNTFVNFNNNSMAILIQAETT